MQIHVLSKVELAHSTHLRHDCRLCSRVHEGLDGVPVDLAVDVEHDDGAEALRVVLHGQLHVGVDVLVLDLVGDHPLRLHVEGVGGGGRQQPHPLRLPLLPLLLLLPQYLQLQIQFNSPVIIFKKFI